MEEQPVASDLRELKIAAARIALAEVRSGMSLGLGTGSTSEEFVKLLGEEIAQGRVSNLRATCTSKATEELARRVGVEITPIERLIEIDLAVDGADEIDSKLRLIKGRGGALLREKIVEQCANRFLVIADSTKKVSRLGGVPLPVEVVQFAGELLSEKFRRMGLVNTIRTKEGSRWVTDEGHWILDVVIPVDEDVADVVARMRAFAGIVETGFFPDEATEAILASESGIERITRR